MLSVLLLSNVYSPTVCTTTVTALRFIFLYLSHASESSSKAKGGAITDHHKGAIHPSLKRNAGFLAFEIGALYEQAAAAHLEEFDLKIQDMRVLWYVVNCEDSPSQQEVADEMRLLKYTVAVSVDKLHDMRLLIRVQNPDNRRENLLHQTDEGRSLVNTWRKRMVKIRKTVFGALSDEEYAHFCRLAVKVLEE